uniref:Uncharacterized protein n=1 Tax=Arundo donax TaxID=35708 RepID=A0A0A9FQI0_ARUDO
MLSVMLTLLTPKWCMQPGQLITPSFYFSQHLIFPLFNQSSELLLLFVPAALPSSCSGCLSCVHVCVRDMKAKLPTMLC